LPRERKGRKNAEHYAPLEGGPMIPRGKDRAIGPYFGGRHGELYFHVGRETSCVMRRSTTTDPLEGKRKGGSYPM